MILASGETSDIKEESKEPDSKPASEKQQFKLKNAKGELIFDKKTN